jgi:hypothetical protein
MSQRKWFGISAVLRFLFLRCHVHPQREANLFWCRCRLQLTLRGREVLHVHLCPGLAVLDYFDTSDLRLPPSFNPFPQYRHRYVLRLPSHSTPLQELDPNVNCSLGGVDLLLSKRSSLKGAS